MLAAVTFLAINGWQADLEPAEATAAVVADLAAGRRSAADLAAWLSPRISAYRGNPPGLPLSPAKEAPMHGWLPNLRRNRPAQGRPDVPTVQPAGPRSGHLGPAGSPGAAPWVHRYRAHPLGLLRDRDGVAGRALHVLGISPEAAREQVLDIIGEGKDEPAGHIPLTPRSKRVLELAVREAVTSTTSTWAPSTSCSAW